MYACVYISIVLVKQCAYAYIIFYIDFLILRACWRLLWIYQLAIFELATSQMHSAMPFDNSKLAGSSMQCHVAFPYGDPILLGGHAKWPWHYLIHSRKFEPHSVGRKIFSNSNTKKICKCSRQR